MKKKSPSKSNPRAAPAVSASRHDREMADIRASIADAEKRAEERAKKREAEHQREMARIKAETDRLDKSNREYRERTIRMLARHRVRIAAEVQNREGLRTNISRGVEDAFAMSFSDIMKDRYGVRLDEVLRRVRNDNQGPEIDILGLNGKVAVVGEAKIRLKAKSVREFADTVAHFREDFPEHSRPTIYGVVAGLAVDEDAAALARKRGFVVLCLDGAVPASSTPKDFRPRPY